MEEKSHAQIRISCQEHVTKVAGDWSGGCLEGVLMQSDQFGKTWL
jgi:hypothetical protein